MKNLPTNNLRGIKDPHRRKEVRKERRRLIAERAKEGFDLLYLGARLDRTGGIKNSSSISLIATIRAAKRVLRLMHDAEDELRRREDLSKVARGQMNREAFLAKWEPPKPANRRKPSAYDWKSPDGKARIAMLQADRDNVWRKRIDRARGRRKRFN